MNIYVGNLPWSIRDQELENLFAEHGTVDSAKVIMERGTNRSRGFGFVEMSSGAEEAIAASMTLKLKAENWWLTNLNQNNTWNT